jgi:energy-coupling factor transporter ATP-binding protein EcfA2
MGHTVPKRPHPWEETTAVSDSRAFAELVRALIGLRQSLDGVTLRLETAGAERARASRRMMVDQLDTYVLPRVLQMDAPLVAVVGGSTGAGKSTLVNSLARAMVSPSGVLRPTTRSPVLVHHPDDADWFTGDRVLPDLPRTARDDGTGQGLRVVAADGVPRGLALLDAPDVDSVVRANRDLATGLLAAADLWLFVTSAARYADQVPWQVLAEAARRSTAVAVVLDRTAPDHVDELRVHLARMLTASGLHDTPLFEVPETTPENGVLPLEAVASLRGWLHELAANGDARGGVVERSLRGTLRALVYAAHQVADEAAEQVVATDWLRTDIRAVYAEAVEAALVEVEAGSLLRGPVVAGWQELMAAGEPERWAEGRSAGVRDRLTSAVRSRARPTAALERAVVEALTVHLVDVALRARQIVAERWRERAPGVRGGDDQDARADMTRELRARAAEAAGGWQAFAVVAARTALAADDPDDDRLAGVAAAVQIAAVSRGVRAGSGAHTAAGGTRTDAAAQAVDVLRRTLDGDPGAMVERVAADLSARVRVLLAADRDVRLAAVEAAGTSADEVERVRAAARDLDDVRASGTGQ